jgi:aminocyclitol acetyltransferase
VRSRLNSLGFKENEDYLDYSKLSYNEPLYNATYDRLIRDTVVGKFSNTNTTLHETPYVKSIGRFCSFASMVKVNANHRMNALTICYNRSLEDYFLDSNERKMMFHGKADNINHLGESMLTIGNDVWIGEYVFINVSKCSRVGNGAVIGTGSIVLDEIPPYAVVYGQPAKVHRYRFSPKEIEILERVKWYDWDNEEIYRNFELINNPDNFFQKFA